MPTLYVVATPIGNLEDITLRALRVLREVAVIAAEDTRTTRKLLTHYDIHTPLVAYHGWSRTRERDRLLTQLEQGDMALVSDAGTPGISDPGYDLVRGAVERGIPVVPVPGPSALAAAIAVSGLPTHQVLFVGFLPRRRPDRKKLLRTVAALPATLVAYESPHRIPSALTDVLEVLGDRRIAVCRELTKLYEEVYRGTVSEALAHFAHPRGEFTLVIEGAGKGYLAPPDDEEDEDGPLPAAPSADGAGEDTDEDA